MKKRIIAALTAMVMVVTMIPASAFAATTDYTVADVKKAIADAAFGVDSTSYKDNEFAIDATADTKTRIEKAEAAYKTLSSAEKNQIEKDWAAGADTNVSYHDLLVARAAYDELVKNEADFAKAQRAILAGEVLETNAAGDAWAGKAYEDLMAAVANLKSGARQYDVVNGVVKKGSKYTVKVLDRIATVNVNADVKDVFGTDFNADYANLYKAVKAINDITSADVNKATVKDPTSNFNNAKAAVGKQFNYTYNVKDYIKYAKGYRNYKAIEVKVVEPKEIVEANDKLVAAKLNVKPTTIKLATADNVAVTEANYTEVKAVFDAAKAVFDKYEADANVKGIKNLETLKTSLANAKEHFDRYDEALKAKAYVEEKSAKTLLTPSEITEVLDKEANKFFGNSKAFDKLNLYLKADAKKYADEFEKLAAKAKVDLGSYTEAGIIEDYAKLIKAELDKVDSINKVEYIKDKEAIVNAAVLIKELKGLEGIDGTNLPTLDPKGDYDALLGALVSANKPSVFSSVYANIVTDAMFGEFQNKCKALVAAKDEVEKKNITAGIDKVYAALPITTVKESKDVKDAIDKFNAELAKLTVAEKSIFDSIEAGKKDADKVATKITALNAEKVAFDFAQDDKVVQLKVKEVVAKINKLKIAANLTEADKAYNAGILAEIDALFAIDGVKTTFFGLKSDGSVDVNYEKNYSGDDANYKNNDAIKLYNEALKKEDIKTELPKEVVAVVSAIAALNTTADVDADMAAYLDAQAKFEALTKANQELVTNTAILDDVAMDIAKRVVPNIEKEMAKLGIVSSVLEAGQRDTVVAVKAMLAKYEAVLVKAGAYVPTVDLQHNATVAKNMFPKLFTVTGTTIFDSSAAVAYFNAVKLIDTEDIAKAIDELVPVYKSLENLATYVASTAKPADNADFAAAIDTYKGLSAYAKEVLVRGTTLVEIQKKLPTASKSITAKNIEDALAIENDVKALVLDYAKADEIKDVVEGSEIPEIVLKDVKGNVIAKDAYVVTPESEFVIGENTLIVTPAKDSKYAGIAKVKFNIVANKPVAPTGLKVLDTDQGILKITVDAVEGANYKFFIRKVGNTAWRESKVRTSNTVVFTECVKNAQYEVKAVIVVDGVFSDEVTMDGTVWTNRIGTKAGKMYTPKFASFKLTGRNAKAVAKNVAYDNEQYRLLWKKAGNTTWKAGSWSTNRTRPVYKLQKGAKYSFKLQYRYKSDVNGSYVNSGYSAIKTATVK